MKYNNLDETLKLFPHWYDKNPYSNFTKTVRVLNNQYVDKCHKIKTLDFAKRLRKPISIHKVQNVKYVYDIEFNVFIDNIKKVNVYVNPVVNNKEKIIGYEKCFTKDYKDDGYNTNFRFTYNGDTRRRWTDNTVVNVVDYKDSLTSYQPKQDEEKAQLIPTDSFIVEVYTYDDYCWVKGFPENDIEDLFRIYQEEKGFTKYLTFEIKKQNIKQIQVFKDDDIILNQELLNREEDNIDYSIYHDYQPQQAQKNSENTNVIIADPNKDNYVFRIILEENDYDIQFNYINLKNNYPNITDYETVNTLPTPTIETLDKIYIIKEGNIYNAYLTIIQNDEYYFRLIERNIDYVDILKSQFDLFIELYDVNHPNCRKYDKTVHKRYNGYDTSNYDCFSHDYSLDMIGKYWSIPRHNFNPTEYENYCSKLSVEYYSRTLPPYNNRLTEDDYHYQQRMEEYMQKYNVELFPVLELWKNYGIWGKLTSRKDKLSTQGQSYLYEYMPYDDDRYTIEESNNKLQIVEGESNPIIINNHEWYETVIVDDLYVIPNNEYHINYIFHTTEPLTVNDRVSYHVYYFDKNNNCHNETVYTPTLNETTANDYVIDETFTVREDAIKIDIVLEADKPFTFEKASLKLMTLADKEAKYMKTKNDYHECVYELEVDYNEIPSNINFSNSAVFEKLLQRSLPLSHKGYLNILYEFSKEDTGVSDGMGEMSLVDFFDSSSNHDNGEDSYEIDLEHFIKEGYHYYLEVKFRQETFPTTEGGVDLCDNDIEDGVDTILEFRQSPYDEPVTLSTYRVIQANQYTTLIYHFTAPENSERLKINFVSKNNIPFEYKDFILKRTEKITKEELWQTSTSMDSTDLP